LGLGAKRQIVIAAKFSAVAANGRSRASEWAAVFADQVDLLVKQLPLFMVVKNRRQR
jgi:hypothetical protein